MMKSTSACQHTIDQPVYTLCIRMYRHLAWMSNCASKTGGRGWRRWLFDVTVSASSLPSSCNSSVTQLHQARILVAPKKSSGSRCLKRKQRKRLQQIEPFSSSDGSAAPPRETHPLKLPLAVHIICIWIELTTNFQTFITQFFMHIHCSKIFQELHHK